MAQAFPSTGSLHLDGEILTGIALDLANADLDYIAPRMPGLEILTPIAATGQRFEGLIQKSAVNAFFASPDQLTSIMIGEQIPMIPGPIQDAVPWCAKKFARAGTIPSEYTVIADERGIASTRFCLGPTVEFVREAREMQVLSAIGTAGNWANSTTLVNDWLSAGADPIGDIMDGVEAVSKFGRADTMILGSASAYALMRSPAFNSPRSLQSDRGTLTEDELAEIIRSRFGIGRVLISRAKYNTSKKASPTAAAVDFMLPDVCWIGKLDGDSMQVGSNFAVRSLAAARVTPMDLWVESQYDVRTGSILFTAAVHEAFPILEPELGYLIENCT